MASKRSKDGSKVQKSQRQVLEWFFVRTGGKVQKVKGRFLKIAFYNPGQGSKEGLLTGKNSKDKRQVFENCFL